jgi:sulfatase maturation enzyme AslB (radical SAM superfamily)
MSDTEWTSVVERVANSFPPELFAIAAREPLLDDSSRLSTLTIIRASERLKINRGIVTNGINLPEFLTMVADSQARPTYIDISLDGPQDVNDAIRGKGTYENVTASLIKTRAWEYTDKLYISFCLNGWSAKPEPLKEMLSWVASNLPNPRLAVLTLMPESHTDPRLILPPGAFERALDILVTYSDKFEDIFIDLFPVSLPNLKELTSRGALPDSSAVLRDGLGNLWGFIENNLYVRYQNVVDFNRHQMYISPEGLWLPASARLKNNYTDYAYGSVLKDDLETLARRAEQHAIHEEECYAHEACKDQPCWLLCRGTNIHCDYLKDRR